MLHREICDHYISLGFLLTTYFDEFWRYIFQQIVDISMVTNCVPLLVDYLLLSYESEFHQTLEYEYQRS